MTPQDRAFGVFHAATATGADEPAGLAIASSGGIAMVEGTAAIRQALLLLLSTMPGERVMRADYGCDLWRLAFAPDDETTQGLAIHFVRRAVERFEPRVDILRIDAFSDPLHTGLLTIELDYRVRATLATDRLTHPVAIAEGAAR